MKTLTKRPSESNDKCVDAAQSQHLSSSDNGLIKSNQTSASLPENETTADRIRKYCLYSHSRIEHNLVLTAYIYFR